MDGPTFRKSYAGANKRQYIYDAASTSDKFNLASFNNAENEMGAEQADLYATLVLKADESFSATFNYDDYELLNGDYNTQMTYLYNEYVQDRSETFKGKDGLEYNVYEETRKNVQAIVDQKEREKWYNELDGFTKFWVDFGTVAGDVVNTIWGIVDKIGDAVTLLWSGTADLLTGFQFHDEISDLTNEAISTDWTGTQAIARELDKIKSVSRVGNTWIGKAIDEVATGIANMLPILIPGVGVAGQVIYGLSMFGGAAGEAVQKNPNIDLFNLTTYAAAVTGVEYATEAISGKIFGGADLIGHKMMGTPLRQSGSILKRIGMDFVSEAFEEGISEIADSLLDVWLVDGADSKIASFNDVLHAAIIGGVTGAIITGAGVAFTSNSAINVATNEIVNYKQANNQWIDGDGNVYKTKADAEQSGRKDISKRYDSTQLKKLSKIDTINLRESMAQASEAMRVDHVDNFLVDKLRNEGLTAEEAKSKYSSEYEKALALDEKNAKTIADTAALLTKTMEWAGVEGFEKGFDIVNQTRERQARLIRHYTEKRSTDNLMYRQLEQSVRKTLPEGTSFNVTEDLNAAQIKLQDEMLQDYGVKVIFGEYGQENGKIQNTSFALNNDIVVLDADLFKNTDKRALAERVVKTKLVERLQLDSNGVLSSKNMSEISKILDVEKHNNYNSSTIKDVELLKSTDVEKLSQNELKKYAELQRNTVAQLLLFDELSVSKIYNGSTNIFKRMYRWLDRETKFAKNAVKTEMSKISYNMLLKSMRMYEDVVANASPNLKYAQAAMNDIGATEESKVRMERKFDIISKNEKFAHWNYIPINSNTNPKDYLEVSNVLMNMTNNKFNFEKAFDPSNYTEDVLRNLNLLDFSDNKTFKYNLNDYLLKNYGLLIDAVHEQFVRVTPFNQHTSDMFTLDLQGLIDKTTTLEEFAMSYPSVGSIFNPEFNDNVYNPRNSTSLYDYQLQIIPVNRQDFSNRWGFMDPDTKTLGVYIDLNSSDIGFEIEQMEHTIFHETQHLIADWNNMYQGGNVGVIAKALRSEFKQEKIKNLYEYLMNDDYVGSDQQLSELAERIYSLLGGEWIAESEIVKNDMSYRSATTVYGQDDYFDISYKPQGGGLAMTIKGYGVFASYKLELFTTEKTSVIPQKIDSKDRKWHTEITDMKGNFTPEFTELQTKQNWTNAAKRLLDDTPKGYVTGIGDASATNEVISKLYPDNKNAKTIEYVNQVMSDMTYLLWYKKQNPNTDYSEVLDMTEVRQFVESDLNTKEKLKEFEEKLNQAGDHIKRHYILNADFDYTLNSVAQVEAVTNMTEGHRGQRAMEKQMTIDERGDSYEEAQEAVTETEETFDETEASMTLESKYEMIDTAVDRVKKAIEKTPEQGFKLIDSFVEYAKSNFDKSQQKYLEKQLIKENILPKKQYEKLINKYKTELSSKTLTAEETDILNTNVSEFTNITQHRDYLDDLKEIVRRHQNDVVKLKYKENDVFKQVYSEEDSKKFVYKDAVKNVDTFWNDVDYQSSVRVENATEQVQKVFDAMKDPNYKINGVEDLSKIDGGTADINGNPIDFKKLKDGYIVSCMNNNNTKSGNKQWVLNHPEFVETFLTKFSDDGKLYMGAWSLNGETQLEPSIWVKDLKIAEQLVDKTLQISFLDVKQYIKENYENFNLNEETIKQINGENVQKTEPVKETKPRKKKTPVETIETATKSEPSTLGDAIVALMESDAVSSTLSQVQDVGESNEELKRVSKEIWQNHADVFTGINDSNYAEVRDTIKKSGNQTALIEFDYYCREFEGRFNKETAKLIDLNARDTLRAAGQTLSTQSHTLHNSKPISDIVNGLGTSGYTVDVDDSIIAEYDERLANKDKHITELESRIKDLEQQLKNKDLNDLEKADISDQLQKVAEEKYLFQNGSNIELMDWLLNNVDLPTVAEVFAKQTQIQKSFIDKLILMSEKADMDGSEIGLYLRDNKTGEVKAFPKTREFLDKWLKKARNFRMWAMLSSPTTWVRNWVGNTGMKSLDVVTNAFERMLSKRFFEDIDYDQAYKTINSNNAKISALQDQLTRVKEGGVEYTNIQNQITKLQKDTHKLEFDMGQLKYQESRAGKAVYDYIADKYGDFILQNLIRKQGSKYDETGGKSGEIKRMERAIEYKSANTLQKLFIKAQDMTQWGLSTGIFGDEPMVKNQIIKNMGNLVASNTDYLLAGIRVEYDSLNKKSNKSKTDEARLNILEKALDTRSVTDIFDALNEGETTRLFENATHRAEEQYFKNGNWLSRKLSEFGSKHPAAAEIISWVMPFPKVASNILTMAYKYSPLGFISTLIKWSEYSQKRAASYTGKIEGFEKANVIRSASQATTGTFMLIAGALMAALGVIDIDDDDYLGPALKVGNFMRISLKDLAPSMTTFSTAAALMYSWKNHKSGVDEALNTLYDNTLLGNVDNIFRYGGLTGFAENVPVSLTSQYVPAVLKLVNNTVFQSAQKDKSGNVLEKMWKTLASSVPGLSSTVADKINPYTGEKMYASNTQNWFLNFIAKASPVTVKYTYGQSELEKEAARLGSRTTGTSGSFKVNGKDYNVTGNEKMQLAKYRANYIESEFNQIYNDKKLVTVKDPKTGKFVTTKYSKLTDSQKQNVLTNLYSKASTTSKIEYWTNNLSNKYIATSDEEYNRLKKAVSDPSKIVLNKNWSKSNYVER